MPRIGHELTSRPRLNSFAARTSAGRAAGRCENVSDMPIMNTKNGKMRSVGVQPCQRACSSGQ